MKLEQTATIPAPRERVWAFLMDVPQVALCVPGVEAVEKLGDKGDRYRGALKVRVGPIALTMLGDIAIIHRDEAAGIARMTADAADKRVGGAIKAALEMVLVDTPGAPGSTDLRITTDAQVMGRIGEFGQPVIRKKADTLMGEFAANLRKALAPRPTQGSHA